MSATKTQSSPPVIPWFHGASSTAWPSKGPTERRARGSPLGMHSRSSILPPHQNKRRLLLKHK
eukprot:9360521-Pyramimonas_sp.AAC.1